MLLRKKDNNGDVLMSYKNEKERMNNEAKRHQKNVWLSIKITFTAFAIILFMAIAILMVSVLVNGISSFLSGDFKLFNFGKDKEAPTIIGPTNGVYVGYVGESPVYKKMVKVEDNVDEAPVLTVDNSAVNKDVVGEYKVHYVAEDAAGNRSTYTLTYVVKSQEYSKATLMEMIAQEADNYGITADMTKTEQVRKIYKYVQSHVAWEDGASGIGESNIPNIDRANWETDWVEEAVRTLESE